MNHPTVSQPADPVPELVERLAQALLTRGWTMASAESCTGGLIAGACTERGGASDWFDRGFVTYANAAKVELLGVPPALIEAHGAVSQEVAHAMAAGAAERARTACALAVTGVAGPSGGGPAKPVGTVWFGWHTPAGTTTERRRFDGDRHAVRRAAVAHALAGLLHRIAADARG